MYVWLADVMWAAVKRPLRRLPILAGMSGSYALPNPDVHSMNLTLAGYIYSTDQQCRFTEKGMVSGPASKSNAEVSAQSSIEHLCSGLAGQHVTSGVLPLQGAAGQGGYSLGLSTLGAWPPVRLHPTHPDQRHARSQSVLPGWNPGEDADQHTQCLQLTCLHLAAVALSMRG